MTRTYYYPSQLPFVADVHSLNRNTGRQIDWSLVPDSYKPDSVSYTITCNGGAAADAVALPVLATPVALPSGTILYFGESKEFAMLTAYAAAGATSLTVQALPQAIEDTDTATYVAVGKSGKHIESGTIVAELASGLVIPRALVTGAETAIGILETDANEPGEAGVGLNGFAVIVGGVIYANMLPDYNDANFATWQGELETAGVGLFVWEAYADDRAS